MPAPTSLQPRKAPRQSRSRVSYEAVLTAAAQILEREGAAALTTNAVAERAGVSIGTLYQYFPGKEAIAAELVRRLKAQLVEDLVGALEEASNLPLRQAAHVVLSASIRHHARAPELSRELERLERDLPLDAEAEAVTAEVYARLAGLLQTHGVPEPAVVARDLTAMSKGLVHAALFAGETDLARIERRLLPAIVGYLGLDPAGDPDLT
ncbi:TetR/AcrR family transcriptional regulator [Salipiger sp. P9]|uniref:TetR/AcrR family transcriptional regulator n=1 Tax=Salipiger pentaromativorans TaxID=2943193 RepID=UPI002157B495|nr:TetR/AcrR family transcriptional regulator [Salipiger pentaromativorans]MCR8549039.1 TetR/AcrR family transcriptional regulator [Salipiger pentaromativorans]